MVMAPYIGQMINAATDNAWVHEWAYHTIAPHVTVGTPNLVNVFRLS